MLRIILTLLVLSAMACKKSDNDDSTALLAEQFHGKYKVLSSLSSEAIDVNQDGTASTNMLQEILTLKETHLELRIERLEHFLFVQFWPEQHFATAIAPTVFDPSEHVAYATQAVTRIFSFDDNLQEILIRADEPPTADTTRWTVPTGVQIRGQNRIEVILNKRVYTTAGWKTVTITTLYERFTNET